MLICWEMLDVRYFVAVEAHKIAEVRSCLCWLFFFLFFFKLGEGTLCSLHPIMIIVFIK